MEEKIISRLITEELKVFRFIFKAVAKANDAGKINAMEKALDSAIRQYESRK